MNVSVRIQNRTEQTIGFMFPGPTLHFLRSRNVIAMVTQIAAVTFYTVCVSAFSSSRDGLKIL